MFFQPNFRINSLNSSEASPWSTPNGIRNVLEEKNRVTFGEKPNFSSRTRKPKVTAHRFWISFMGLPSESFFGNLFQIRQKILDFSQNFGKNSAKTISEPQKDSLFFQWRRVARGKARVNLLNFFLKGEFIKMMRAEISRPTLIISYCKGFEGPQSCP